MDDTDILSKKDTRSEETQTDKKLVFFMLFICAYHVWFINFQQYQDNQTYWESKAWTVIITDLRHCKSYHL